MKNRQWNREFPDVPDHVHQTVLDTLAGLDNKRGPVSLSSQNSMHIRTVQKGAKMKRVKTRTMIILAAALVIVLGTTVAAAELFRWNERATEIFEAEPELQNKLTVEEIAREEYQSVTDNGLTITAIQTIQDSNCFYALFEVAAEDGSIVIDENCGMDYLLDFQGAEDPFCAMGWGFVDNRRQEPGSSRYFEIFGTKMEESADDLHMGINFTTLTGPGEKAMDGAPMVEGNWDFDLTIRPAASTHVDLNREYQIAGCQVRVESVDLSPLTGKITCNGEDIKVLTEKEGVNLDQLDVLVATQITGIKYQDGTVADQDGYSTLWESYPEGGSYAKLVRFSQVIEPEKVSALLLGNEKDEIILQ